MPLNIRSFPGAFLIILTIILAVSAQEITPTSAPSSADVMRQRVAKAKAFIVVKNYPAAIYELENIKRESSDPTLDSVINVLLMNSYLEQGDYRRAQEFLTELSKAQKANKPNAAANYFAAAAQVIKSARTQLERYHSLGLNVSDRTLPEAAAADVERMRATLELVVEQSREMGKEGQYMDTAMALLEGATAARSSLAKDDYDANRWRIEVSDAREMMANSRTTVINAVGPDPQTPDANLVAGNTRGGETAGETGQSPAILLPASNDERPATAQPSAGTARNTTRQPSTETVAGTDKPVETPVTPPAEEPKPAEEAAGNRSSNETGRRRIVVDSAPRTESEQQPPPPAETAPQQTTGPRDNSPIEVGSLVGYATKKTNPVYPSIARNMRMTGVVKVEIIVDEEGRVAEVQSTDGPTLLQDAAQNAIRKWKFRPFTRDGEPVRALGYVSFNFSL